MSHENKKQLNPNICPNNPVHVWMSVRTGDPLKCYYCLKPYAEFEEEMKRYVPKYTDDQYSY